MPFARNQRLRTDAIKAATANVFSNAAHGVQTVCREETDWQAEPKPLMLAALNGGIHAAAILSFSPANRFFSSVLKTQSARRAIEIAPSVAPTIQSPCSNYLNPIEMAHSPESNFCIPERDGMSWKVGFLRTLAASIGRA